MPAARILIACDDSSHSNVLRECFATDSAKFEVTRANTLVSTRDYLHLNPVDLVVVAFPSPSDIVTLLESLAEMTDSCDTSQPPPTAIALHHSNDAAIRAQFIRAGAFDVLEWLPECDRLRHAARLAVRQRDTEQQCRRQAAELRRQWIRLDQLESDRLELLWKLGKAAELRDEQSGNHVLRVAFYSKIVAHQMALPAAVTERLFLAAPLHDIGKISVPDRILMKPGALSPNEWDSIFQHCEAGGLFLEQTYPGPTATGEWPDANRSNEQATELMRLAATIARHHHEKWDGTGYPAGLSGDDIPLEARIVAVADVYDALRSKRPYKPAFSPEDSQAIIRNHAGSHFDPQVVAAFLAAYDRILEIERHLADPQPANMPRLDSPTQPRPLALLHR